jgi:hypothetical protein
MRSEGGCQRGAGGSEERVSARSGWQRGAGVSEERASARSGWQRGAGGSEGRASARSGCQRGAGVSEERVRCSVCRGVAGSGCDQINRESRAPQGPGGVWLMRWPMLVAATAAATVASWQRQCSWQQPRRSWGPSRLCGGLWARGGSRAPQGSGGGITPASLMLRRMLADGDRSAELSNANKSFADHRVTGDPPCSSPRRRAASTQIRAPPRHRDSALTRRRPWGWGRSCGGLWARGGSRAPHGPGGVWLWGRPVQ